MRKNCKRRFINLQPKSMEREYRVLCRNLGKQSTELETKEKHLKLVERELQEKVYELTTELESKERENNSLRCSIDEKEKQIGEKVKEISECESKLNERHEVHMRDIEELQEKNDKLATQLESKERENNSLRLSIDEKEKQIGEKVQENKHLLGRVEELESKEKRLEARVKEHEVKEAQVKVQLKKLESENKQFQQQAKDLKTQQVQCHSTDGGNLQLLSDDTEVTVNDILAESSDPAKLVLDLIQKPILAQNIDENCISLLEQLMRMSPRIKPLVKEEAFKLAFDLKENMENSWMALGFLLLLSIYGLVSYFDEDEVLKLVEFSAQHKQAIGLIRTLGFVENTYDFIQNLIIKKLYIEAVGFICAYELVEKFQPVNLLRKHIEQMSQRYGRRNGTERKDRDEEIASLEIEMKKLLQCISDNNLESQDLVDEIKDRINCLEKENEDVVSKASEYSCSKVEAITKKNQVQQQPKGKKRANEVEQPSHKIRFDSAVRGRQPEKRKCTIEAAIKTQVRQPREKKRAIEAVSGGHDLKPWGDKRPRTERVEVRQKEEESEGSAKEERERDSEKVIVDV